MVLPEIPRLDLLASLVAITVQRTRPRPDAFWRTSSHLKTSTRFTLAQALITPFVPFVSAPKPTTSDLICSSVSPERGSCW